MKGPPVPISADFYLSVLAAKAVLPPLLMVVRPNADNGAVEGLGVPLRTDAQKEDLAKPIERGIYAISTPDQKTVLKVRVFSKEEAYFDPDSVLSSSIAERLDPEIRDRIRSTWTILQLTFEAYDPKLYPALDFMLNVASRLGVLTEGVIADPLAGQYRLPESLPSPRDEKEKFDVRDFVTVQSRMTTEGLSLVTAGLAKFGQPELAISMVPQTWSNVADNLLLSAAAGVMKGKTLDPGDVLFAYQGWFVSEAASSGPTWDGAKVLEFLPLKGSVDDTFTEWANANK